MSGQVGGLLSGHAHDPKSLTIFIIDAFRRWGMRMANDSTARMNQLRDVGPTILRRMTRSPVGEAPTRQTPWPRAVRSEGSRARERL